LATLIVPALMINGATGYTGRMAAEHAAAAELDPILAADGSHVTVLADELGVDHRVFGPRRPFRRRRGDLRCLRSAQLRWPVPPQALR
jgi:short subunit dehydrogenase-like uncharacterized protein